MCFVCASVFVFVKVLLGLLFPEEISTSVFFKHGNDERHREHF